MLLYCRQSDQEQISGINALHLPIAFTDKYRNNFYFQRCGTVKEIRKFIEANGGKEWELNYTRKMDEISVSSCYVSARLRSVFAEGWENFKKQISRTNNRGEIETVNYTIEEIWHILFSFEDEENFIEFLKNRIEFNDEQIKELIILFKSFPVGYANLSLKAISNILPFLREGIIYSEAVILAKLPEIIGKNLFDDNKFGILEEIKNKVEEIRYQKTIVNIANNLIFKYYALDFDNRFGWKDITYKLDESDYKSVEIACIENFGDKTWGKFDSGFQENVKSAVANLYQIFFGSVKREHIKQPHLVNSIKDYISKNFDVSEQTLNKIYHPSQIDIYPKREVQQYLLSPKTAAFKNPMAYKTLYKLKDVMNH